MKIHYTKMEANGNTYIIIEQKELNLSISLKKLALKISNTNYGIGSDGLIVIDSEYRPVPNARLFNSDGSEATLCGNGLRLVGKYLFDKIDKGKTILRIKTIQGIYTCINDHNILIKIPAPIIEDSFKTVINGKNILLFPVILGNKHIYIINQNINKYIYYSGSIKHILNKYQANVGIITLVNKKNINILTHELGSENNKSSGSNIAGAIGLLAKKNMICKDTYINVHTPGGTIHAKYTNDNSIISYGSINYICTGDYHYKK